VVLRQLSDDWFTMSNLQMSMDAILDAALDELDDEDDDNDANNDDCNDPHDQEIKVNLEAKGLPVGDCGKLHPSEPKDCTSNTAGLSPVLDDDEMEQLKNMMNEIMRATISAGVDEDDLGQVMTKLQQQMAMEMEHSQKNRMEKIPPSQENETTHAKKPVAGPQPPSPRRPVFGPEPPPPRSSDVDRTISNLLNGMAASAATKVDDAVADDNDDIDEMMKQFQTLGGDEMIDGMMQQLLAKDLMYEPIKEVTAKFPKWLEDNKESLSDDEYHK
jgi:peroxin-19